MRDAIASAKEAAPAGEDSWSRRPLGALMEHLVERYHASLREELPNLLVLAGRVEKAHAGNVACPSGISGHLAEILSELETHLVKEEGILYPMIYGGRGGAALLPVKVMMQEHEDLLERLRRIRVLTNDFTLPPEACPTWGALYEGLIRLEAELREHAHLENDVLFPRAIREADAPW